MELTRKENNKITDDITTGITIVHQNVWDPEQHGATFLQSIVDGFLRRRLPISLPEEEKVFSPPL